MRRPDFKPYLIPHILLSSVTPPPQSDSNIAGTPRPVHPTLTGHIEPEQQSNHGTTQRSAIGTLETRGARARARKKATEKGNAKQLDPPPAPGPFPRPPHHARRRNGKAKTAAPPYNARFRRAIPAAIAAGGENPYLLGAAAAHSLEAPPPQLPVGQSRGENRSEERESRERERE
ncbi:hypothetical protein NL676_021116 [Syzygium grande]|nr:hypothetical protein NL676_021116 [Syzygium grande]